MREQHWGVASIAMALLVGWAIAGCGDDAFHGAHHPDPPDPDPVDHLPVQTGDTFWYPFSHTYRRTTGPGDGGLTVGEKQSSGHLCVKVMEVRDTVTEAFADQPETTIQTQAKVAGSVSDADIVFSDQDATGAPDDQVVDASMENLWLKQAAFPSRNHGFLTPKSVQFHTRQAPTPPDLSIAKLLFFDVRMSPDMAWGGWDLRNDECSMYLTEAECPAECLWDLAGSECKSNTDNLLRAIFRYFTDNLPEDYIQNSQLFWEHHSVTAACSDHPDLATCQASGCAWDFAADDGAGACVDLYSIEIIWRETLATGPNGLLQAAVNAGGTYGAVVHRIRFDFNAIGALRHATEYVVPDMEPNTPVHELLPEAQCLTAGCSDHVEAGPCNASLLCHWDPTANQGAGGCVEDFEWPCATATFELDDRDWSEAYCQF